MKMITINELDNLIKDRGAKELEHMAEKKESIDPGFNLFSLISDLYYRENLHSDIISAILDINGKHGEGNKYLLILIELINKSNKVKIDPEFYKNEVKVEREKGRRDITISGSNSHAIIIENKINDAHDTLNQIPKYVEHLENQNIKVDAVLYLTLNHAKEPKETTWQIDDKKKQELKSKLVSIRAHNCTPNDLCNGWLEECIKVTNDIDTLSILRQYLKIIKYLTRNHMNHQFMQEFDQYLRSNPQNAAVIIAIENTAREFPKYIQHQIFEHFKLEDRYHPFESIEYWKDDFPYLNNLRIANFAFNSDIIVHGLHKCTIDFSVRDDYAYEKEFPEEVLKTINMIDKFEWNDQRFIHTIEGNFIEFEDKAINFINLFIEKLKTNKSKIEASLLQLEQK